MIMNPYYYLFYKLSRFLNKKGNNEWGVMYAHSLLNGWNIGLIYIKILPVTKENFNTGYKIVLIVIGIVLFITNYILFLHKNKYKQIVKRYEKETSRNKKIGTFFVVMYIVLTYLSIFFI
jgi:hypothetical protein